MHYHFSWWCYINSTFWNALGDCIDTFVLINLYYIITIIHKYIICRSKVNLTEDRILLAVSYDTIVHCHVTVPSTKLSKQDSLHLIPNCILQEQDFLSPCWDKYTSLQSNYVEPWRLSNHLVYCPLTFPTVMSFLDIANKKNLSLSLDIHLWLVSQSISELHRIIRGHRNEIK